MRASTKAVRARTSAASPRVARSTGSYADLTTALEQAAAAAARRAPARRLAAVAHAYRDWALAHPRRYAMLFGERPDGAADDAAAIDAIHGGMHVLLDLFAELAGGGVTAGRGDKLDRQLTRWAAARSGPTAAPPLVLRLGVLTWTRLHGIVGLELSGAFASMGIDAGLLIDAELEQAVALATEPA